MQNPSSRHHAAADQAITYLYGTKNLAIEFSAGDDEKVFIGASDAAYADDSLTRRSSEGYLFHLFGGAVDWHATKQKTVTTSTTKAELLALSHAAKEIYWWKHFFKSIQLDPGHELGLSCDNLQMINLLIKDSVKLVTKLKHIDIHKHWLRQEMQDNRLIINWIPTGDMPADGLTKALSRQKHESFIRQLSLVDIEEQLKELL